MATRRTILGRSPRVLDDFKLSELLSLQAPLIHGGFYDPDALGLYCSDKRDVAAIERTWHEREHELLMLWISGWQPAVKFVMPFEPGRPGTRPPAGGSTAHRNAVAAGNPSPTISIGSICGCRASERRHAAEVDLAGNCSTRSAPARREAVIGCRSILLDGLKDM
jgi:hypothetical protein